MKFLTPYNYHENVELHGRPERNTLPSETIPDETMTVREIFTRYANGQNLGAPIRDASKLVNPDLPINWATMDLSEKQDFAEQHRMKLTEAKKFIDEKRAEEDEKAYKELIIAEYEASKKQANDPAPPSAGASDRSSDQK